MPLTSNETLPCVTATTRENLSPRSRSVTLATGVGPGGTVQGTRAAGLDPCSRSGQRRIRMTLQSVRCLRGVEELPVEQPLNCSSPGADVVERVPHRHQVRALLVQLVLEVPEGVNCGWKLSQFLRSKTEPPASGWLLVSLGRRCASWRCWMRPRTWRTCTHRRATDSKPSRATGPVSSAESTSSGGSASYGRRRVPKTSRSWTTTDERSGANHVEDRADPPWGDPAG